MQRVGRKVLVAAPPDGRALWLRHDGLSVHLMASTCFIPAGLVLPVDDCFEVRILRVDRMSKRLYVRPLSDDEQFDQLEASLCAMASGDSQGASTQQPVAQPFSMSTVYIARTEIGYQRTVLLKKEKASVTCLMYGIDKGKVFTVNSNEVYELPASLRAVPPLCFCAVLQFCDNTQKCNEFESFNEETICICKISNEFPSNYPRRAKEIYPPAIMSRLYKKNGQENFVEIKCKASNKILETPNSTEDAGFIRTVDPSVSCASVVAESPKNKNNGKEMPRRRNRALVVKSASVPTVFRDPTLPFVFRKFNVSLPAKLTARVTERIDYDTYLMRKHSVINELEKHLAPAVTPLTPRVCFDRGICCMALLIRPARANCSTFQPQLYRRSSSVAALVTTVLLCQLLKQKLMKLKLIDIFHYFQNAGLNQCPQFRVKRAPTHCEKFPFRAIANEYRKEDNTCEVILVDFGQTVVCSISNLFELYDQPVEVLEMPTASFRCRVKRFSPSKKNGTKAIKLLDENDYSVCLTLKCARDLYWAKITLADTDFVLCYNKKSRRRKELIGNPVQETKNGSTECCGSVNFSKDEARLQFERRKEELLEEEQRLRDKEELLRKEKEEFVNDSIKREQEIRMITLQMQLWDISAKMDLITSNNPPYLTRTNITYPQLQQDNCGFVPIGMTSCYGQSGIDFVNGNNAILQQNVGLNRLTEQQWPPPQHLTQSDSSVRCTPYVMGPSIPYGASDNCYEYGANICYRKMNEAASASSQNGYCSLEWQTAPVDTSRPLIISDNSMDSTNEYIVRMRPSSKDKTSTMPIRANVKSVIAPTAHRFGFVNAKTTESVFSNSASDALVDTSRDSSHGKLQYGEPPHRTISDYCNTTAKNHAKQASTLDLPCDILRGSVSAASQNGHIFREISCRQNLHGKKNSSENIEEVLRTGTPEKIVYTSDDSTDSGHGISDYQYRQQKEVFRDSIYILEGSELLARRVGTDSDWPVFFIVPEVALQNQSIECFNSLRPTKKLCANEIAVGLLCVVNCGKYGSTKVRAIVEHVEEEMVYVRHIDHAHVDIVKRDELWSVDGLSSSVRTHPALAVPCILSPSIEVEELNGEAGCTINQIPCVGQRVRFLFKKHRESDGIWIVTLIGGSG